MSLRDLASLTVGCALLVAVLALGGCPRRPRATDAGAAPPRDAGVVEQDAGEQLPAYESDFELAYFDEARRALDATGPGTTGAQLTPDGRWRAAVERGPDGTVTRTLLRDGAVVRTTVWSADGLTITSDHDDDDDGRAETHVETTRGPTSADQRMVVTETASDGAIRERHTLARIDETTIHVTIERPDATGTLATMESFDTDAVQGAPLIRPLDPDGIAGCDNDVATLVVRRAVETGIAQGLACMESIDPRTHRCLLDALSTRDVAVHCTSETPFHAQISMFDTLVGPVDGAIDIAIDERRFFDLPGDASRAGTMFHELMHVCRGVHDPASIRAGVYQPYSDPIAGCVATCFGATTADRCTCGTCRRTDSCDPRCAHLPSCRANHWQCDPCTRDDSGPRFETQAECEMQCDDSGCKGGGCFRFRPPCST